MTAAAEALREAVRLTDYAAQLKDSGTAAWDEIDQADTAAEAAWDQADREEIGGNRS